MKRKKNVLFVCHSNVSRSKTAERVFKGRYGMNTRSAGIASWYGGLQIDEELLSWADLVFVMEAEQKGYIRQRFPKMKKDIIVLDIPDIYNPMEKELVDELKLKVIDRFGRWLDGK